MDKRTALRRFHRSLSHKKPLGNIVSTICSLEITADYPVGSSLFMAYFSLYFGAVKLLA